MAHTRSDGTGETPRVMVTIERLIEAEAFARMILVDAYPGEMPLETTRLAAGMGQP